MTKSEKLILGIAGLLLGLLVLARIGEAKAEHRPITTTRASPDKRILLDRPHHDGGRQSEYAVYTSPCIHKHWEGVILPIDGQPGDIRLLDVNLEAQPRFFSCMVRNFIIDATAVFTLENRSSASASNYTLGFPLSTHALYGDHNEFRDIQIRVDGAPVPYEVAMDHDLYEIRGPYEELYYKGRQINWQVHPLISDTMDLHDLSPSLVEEGFDMVAYWLMEFAPHEQRVVQVDYASSSNDFSGCCREVGASARGIDAYHFYFDLSNARYWQHPTDVHILLNDGDSALWSAVPQLNLERICTKTSIEFRGEDVLLTEDLAAPVEPAIFRLTPRCWPSGEVVQQEFSLKWIEGSSLYTQTKIYAITSTTDVVIDNVELPLYLSEMTPTATYSVTLNPVQPFDLAYMDVYGVGSGFFESLYHAFVRVPITGHVVTGHDLAITNVTAPDCLTAGQEVTITGVVENLGSFDEGVVLASVYSNGNYAVSAAFPGLDAGEAREIKIGWIVNCAATCRLDVEIEPIPGEVNRHNNAASTSTAVQTNLYLPTVLKNGKQ